MGVLGSPELPGESEDSLKTSNTHITNYGSNTSDDSDEERGDISYEGYEPLNLGDNIEQDVEVNNSLVEEQSLSPTSTANQNLPIIINNDIEYEREVWNQPRPQELEIHLDSTRTEQIMSAMANISLPAFAIPEWAQGVPEELWKQNLLERIRQRKDTIPQETH